MPVQGAHQYFDFDSDGANIGFAAITGTTPGTANLLMTLTTNRRQAQFVNTTDKVVLLARRRINNPGVTPVYFAAVPAGGSYTPDFRTNMNGWNLGDQIFVYAPAALASGTFYGSAQ